jgi:hypothetical protein
MFVLSLSLTLFPFALVEAFTCPEGKVEARGRERDGLRTVNGR